MDASGGAGQAYGWIGKAARPAAFAFLFVAALALAANAVSPFAMDFVSYWAAGKLTLAGNPIGSYDIALHRGVELQVAPVTGAMPFPYPPPFLFLVAPFALLPFPVAAICWVGTTFLFYLFAVRRLAPGGGWIAVAFPPVLTTAVIGQNGFLLCGLLALGMALLPRRPLLAGMVLGCLIIKPQLGVVLPFALLAVGQWRAIMGAAASSMGLFGLGAAVFGVESYLAWIGQAPTYASIVVEGLSGWHRMASLYTSLRLAGIGEATALALHVLAAAAATIAACLIWRRSADPGARAGALAAATALISPYLYGYDTIVLVLPFLWLARDPRNHVPLAAIWCLSLAGFLQNWAEGLTINVMPAVAVALLALVWKRVAEAGRPQVSVPLSLGAAV